MDRRLALPLSVAQVLVKWNLDGQPAESVFYVKHQHRDTELGILSAANFNVANADYVAGLFKSWIQDHWSANAHARAAATEVDVIWNTVLATGPLEGRVYQDSDYPIPGTGSGGGMPNNVTAAVELRTDLLGRSFHGRTYFPGALLTLVDAATDPNVITPGNVGVLINMYEALRTALASLEFHTLGVADAINDNFPLQVASFRSGGADRTLAVCTTVTSCTMSDAFVDSMRRRLPGHNRHR